MNFSFMIMGINAWPIIILFLFCYVGYRLINRRSNYNDLLDVDDPTETYFATEVINRLTKRLAMKNKFDYALTERWETQTRFGNKVIGLCFNQFTFMFYMLIIVYYSSLSIVGFMLTINIPAIGVISIIAGAGLWRIMNYLNHTGYVYNITNYNYAWFWKIKRNQIDITDIVMENDNKKIKEINDYINDLPIYDWDLIYNGDNSYDIYDTIISFRHKKDSIAFKLSLL